MKLDSAGTVTLAMGLLLLGVVSVTSGEFIPTLQPIPEAFEMPGTVARLNGILVAALSASILIKRFQGPAAALLAAYLSTWLFVAQLPQLFFEAFDITRLVSLLELAAVVAALIILAFGKDFLDWPLRPRSEVSFMAACCCSSRQCISNIMISLLQ